MAEEDRIIWDAALLGHGEFEIIGGWIDPSLMADAREAAERTGAVRYREPEPLSPIEDWRRAHG